MNNDEINKDDLNFPGKEENFSLPENYFDSFSKRLFKKIAAENELNEYPLLTSLKNKNPFSVPAGYFELKEELLSCPLLAENKSTSFTTPDLYFETLPEKILHAISLEEEKDAYTLLYAHKKEDTFTVPATYFEEFKVETDVKVVPLYQRIKLSYKIAAAVTLIVGSGILFYTQQTKPVVSNDCNTFACLDKKEILNSGYVLHVSDDNIIDLIDEKSLSDSLFLKKDGKTQKIDMTDVSDNVDINTLTDNL